MTYRRTILNAKKAIKIRQSVREGTYGSLKALGEKYGVKGNTIIAVIRGRTFREVNDIEPPITKELVNPRRVRQVTSPDDEYLDKLIAMRRTNPKKWTFKALAEFMKEDSEFRMSKFRLSELMVQRDPTLSKRRPKSEVPYVRRYNRVCVMCEEPFKSKTRTTEVCFNQECRDMWQQELAYERAHR